MYMIYRQGRGPGWISSVLTKEDAEKRIANFKEEQTPILVYHLSEIKPELKDVTVRKWVL